MGIPTRIIYWNVPGHDLMYIPFAALCIVFGYGIYRRWRVWSKGRRVDLGPLGPRFRRLFSHALLQSRVVRSRLSGYAHAVLFVSFGIMTGATIVVALQADLGWKIMQGPFYLWYQSLLVDMAGLAAAVAIAIFLWRRYGVRPRALTRAPADFLLPFTFLVILVTGFVIESLRIYATHDPWGPWSPVGYALSLLWGDIGLGLPAALGLHRFLWWFHLFVAFSFMAAIPYSKLFHFVMAPVAIFYSEPERGRELRTPDLQNEERLGANLLSDLTVKDLIDLDACTECGRCQDACPAYASGKPLSPKALILDLRRASATRPESPLTEVIADDTLMACTTCRACMEACPVDIEHVPKIIAMRAFRAMEEGEIPAGLAEAVTGIEERGHPFRGAQASRTTWLEGTGLPVWEVGEPCETLLWVGCAGAFDARAQEVAKALAGLLLYMGEDVRVLGERESCTGDPARRAGQEYLYQMQAERNVAQLREVAPRRIVTMCPHCLQQLRTEYRAFGGDFKVVHHTVYLQMAVASGRLALAPEAVQRLTYHDPCYLGRWNGIVDEPRALLREAGAELVEMAHHGTDSLCCGAGGGWAFREEPSPRVNQLRAKEAAATGASTVVTSCPFCLNMMTDGMKGEGEAKVKDIAEILWEEVQARVAAK